MESGEKRKFRILGEEPITAGFEKRVYAHEDAGRIVKVEREHSNKEPDTERKVKAKYYLTKILHLLFPSNIPDMYLATSQPTAVTVHERVGLDEEHRKINDVFSRIAEIGDVPVAQAIETAKAAKIIEDHPSTQNLVKRLHDLGLQFDSTGGNITFDQEGNPVYLDDFQVWYRNKENEVIPFFNDSSLDSVIQTLEEPQRQKASNYLTRLKTLLQEEQEKSKA